MGLVRLATVNRRRTRIFAIGQSVIDQIGMLLIVNLIIIAID
jgi:hypothetical protein